MTFTDLSLKHKDEYSKFISKSSKKNCDFSFATLYLWRSYYKNEIYITKDILYIRCMINNTHLYYIPLGDTKKGIECLIEYTNSINEQLIIIGIENEDLPLFDKKFTITHVRDNDDYIYFAQDLALLSGGKFKAKRNFVNTFQKNYNYSVELLSDLADDSINDFLQKQSSFIEEPNIINEALLLKNELSLEGLILRVDNKIAAITIGSYNKNNDTFITHFEKADYSYIGASQMINYLLANHVRDKAKYINREEDLGIEGIRKAKLSYNPIELIKSYKGTYKKP